MRRLIAGAAAGLCLLLAAPIALAQDSNPASFAGSRITGPPVVTTDDPLVITANITRVYTSGSLTIDTFFRTPAGLPSGCPAPGESPPLATARSAGPNGSTNTSATVPTTPACNGTYTARVTATYLRPASLVPPREKVEEHAEYTAQVRVVIPPPDVTGATGKVEGGTVMFTWSPVSPRPTDFTGYRVERQDASGKYVPVATLGPTATTFTDASPPPEGGEVSYHVLATRNGVGTDVASDGGGRVTVTLPATTSTTTPEGTTGGATDGGTAGTAGTEGTGGTAGAGGTAGTAGTTDTTTGRTRTPARGRTGIGTRAPRLGTDTGAIGLLIPPDDSFDEVLDYGDGVLPGDEAEGDVSLSYEDDTGRGLAVPIGIGAVLAGWGMHLFFLARAARPTRVPVDPYGYPVEPYGY